MRHVLARAIFTKIEEKVKTKKGEKKKYEKRIATDFTMGVEHRGMNII